MSMLKECFTSPTSSYLPEIWESDWRRGGIKGVLEKKKKSSCLHDRYLLVCRVKTHTKLIGKSFVCHQAPHWCPEFY